MLADRTKAAEYDWLIPYASELEAQAREPQVHFQRGPAMSYFEFSDGKRFVYQTLCNGGLKAEGNIPPALETSAAAAWAAFWVALHDYLADRRAVKAVWRKPPDIVESEEYPKTFWVHSRLAVLESADG
jgi:hypothetical protein